MPLLLGNLKPQMLVEAFRSLPRQATSSLKVRYASGGTRGSEHRVGRKRGSDISEGRGGQHNEVVQTKKGVWPATQKVQNDNKGSDNRKDEARVEANAGNKVGN